MDTQFKTNMLDSVDTFKATYAGKFNHKKSNSGSSTSPAASNASGVKLPEWDFGRQPTSSPITEPGTSHGQGKSSPKVDTNGVHAEGSTDSAVAGGSPAPHQTPCPPKKSYRDALAPQVAYKAGGSGRKAENDELKQCLEDEREERKSPEDDFRQWFQSHLPPLLQGVQKPVYYSELVAKEEERQKVKEHRRRIASGLFNPKDPLMGNVGVQDEDFDRDVGPDAIKKRHHKKHDDKPLPVVQPPPRQELKQEFADGEELVIREYFRFPARDPSEIGVADIDAVSVMSLQDGRENSLAGFNGGLMPPTLDWDTRKPYNCMSNTRSKPFQCWLHQCVEVALDQPIVVDVTSKRFTDGEVPDCGLAKPYQFVPSEIQDEVEAIDYGPIYWGYCRTNPSKDKMGKELQEKHEMTSAEAMKITAAKYMKLKRKRSKVPTSQLLTALQKEDRLAIAYAEKAYEDAMAKEKAAAKEEAAIKKERVATKEHIAKETSVKKEVAPVKPPKGRGNVCVKGEVGQELVATVKVEQDVNADKATMSTANRTSKPVSKDKAAATVIKVPEPVNDDLVRDEVQTKASSTPKKRGKPGQAGALKIDKVKQESSAPKVLRIVQDAEPKKGKKGRKARDQPAAVANKVTAVATESQQSSHGQDDRAVPYVISRAANGPPLAEPIENFNIFKAKRFNNPFSPKVSMYIRPARKPDLEQIIEIYNHWRRDSVNAIEIYDTKVADWAQRFEEANLGNKPFIVAVLKVSKIDTVREVVSALQVTGKPKKAQRKGWTAVDESNGFANDCKRGGASYRRRDINLNCEEIVIGFALSERFSFQNTIFDFTAETLLYVHPDYQHKGVMKNLMDRVLASHDMNWEIHYGTDFTLEGKESLNLHCRGGAHVKKTVISLFYEHDKPDDFLWKKSVLENMFSFHQASLMLNIGDKKGKPVCMAQFVRESGAWANGESKIYHDQPSEIRGLINHV